MLVVKQVEIITVNCFMFHLKIISSENVFQCIKHYNYSKYKNQKDQVGQLDLSYEKVVLFLQTETN